jgi:hypothetical protein
MALAYTVESVQALLFPSKDGHLIIQALGTVTSGGWSQARLSPYVYITPPADGIWDFSLQASPPAGRAPAVITPITASAVIPAPQDCWLKGVRIHASANHLEVLLKETSAFKSGSGISLMWDGDLPWPDVLHTDGEGIVGNG